MNTTENVLHLYIQSFQYYLVNIKRLLRKCHFNYILDENHSLYKLPHLEFLPNINVIKYATD